MSLGPTAAKSACSRCSQSEALACPPFAPPFLKAGNRLIGQTANILLFLGERHGLAPKSAAGRLWTHQLQLTIADLVGEVHDTHHPIASSLYYEDQRREARRAPPTSSRTGCRNSSATSSARLAAQPERTRPPCRRSRSATPTCRCSRSWPDCTTRSRRRWRAEAAVSARAGAAPARRGATTDRRLPCLGTPACRSTSRASSATTRSSTASRPSHIAPRAVASRLASKVARLAAHLTRPLARYSATSSRLIEEAHENGRPADQPGPSPVGPCDSGGGDSGHAARQRMHNGARRDDRSHSRQAATRGSLPSSAPARSTTRGPRSNTRSA